MGFPPQFFTVLFALPRVTGYLAHWREQLTDPDVKIARPQQNYTVRLLTFCSIAGDICEYLKGARAVQIHSSLHLSLPNCLRVSMVPFLESAPHADSHLQCRWLLCVMHWLRPCLVRQRQLNWLVRDIRIIDCNFQPADLCGPRRCGCRRSACMPDGLWLWLCQPVTFR